MMHAMKDQRKFIRDIKGLVKNGAYPSYFEEQQKYDKTIREAYAAVEVRGKGDVDRFAEAHTDITEKLQMSMERALLRSRTQQLKAKPSENVSKSIDLMMDVDPRQFERMNVEEKEVLKGELEELAKIVDGFRKLI